MRIILCMAITGIIPEFNLADLTEKPFKSRTNIHPSRDLLKRKILRRDAGIKGIAKLGAAEILGELSDKNTTTMTRVYIAYVRTQFNRITELFSEEICENITNLYYLCHTHTIQL